MKIKTSTLTGSALNFAVATGRGLSVSFGDWYKPEESCQLKVSRSASGVDSIYWHLGGRYNPAEDWAQGGPIIEQECLSPEPLLDENCILIEWTCRNWRGDGQYYSGETVLEAAMRCYVASKFGDEVEIPKELL